MMVTHQQRWTLSVPLFILCLSLLCYYNVVGLSAGGSELFKGDDVYPIYKDEQALYTQLFANQPYNKLFRPQKQAHVKFLLALNSILEVNEKEGHITTTNIPKITWVDQRLKWNSTNYSSINHLQLPCSQLWMPDIDVLNRYRETTDDTTMNPLCWLHSDGTVFFIPRRTIQTPCTFDLTHFPFDTQSCQIIFGSWAYLKNELDINLIDNGTDRSFFIGHTDWTLLNFEMKRIESFYSANNIPFIELLVKITLVRRPKYFYYMFLVPADTLIFLIPLVHFLPPSKEGKIILLSAVFICATLMFNTLEDFMPGYAVDDPPKVVKIYAGAIIMALASGVITAFCMCLANPRTKTKRVPIFLRKILSSRFVNICCISMESRKQDYELLRFERNLLQRSENSSTSDASEREMNSTSQDGETRSHGNEWSAVADSLHRLVGELQLARNKEQMILEWQQLAQIIDRIVGFIWFIIIMVFVSESHSS